MREKDLIIIWFDRFDTLNKGVLRIFAVVSAGWAGLGVFGSAGFLAYSLVGYQMEVLHFRDLLVITGASFGVAVLFLLGYTAFWLGLRLLLWFYDGFRG